ncbi:MAG: hypothetical protein JWL73_369 [Actinomycetia bacterium]|nr:hypothetical protein [Actinomycetes bacterium]
MVSDARPSPPLTASRPVTPGRVSIIIGFVGVLITASLTFTAWTLDQHNETRLLQVQTEQVGALLGSTILGISSPLTTALQIETATNGDPQAFTRFMSTVTGPNRVFVSASLWRLDGPSAGSIATVGVQPDLDAASIRASGLKARAKSTFAVVGLPRGRLQRIGYAVTSATAPTFVVYAERSIPANRRVPIETNSAFADLHFATYLGRGISAENLATTDLPADRLPLSGRTAREQIPFGNTTLTLVTTPANRLGGGLEAALPWILLVGGVVLTIATAVVAEQLVRRRRTAESHSGTINALYRQLDDLYREQRTIAETLQRALLPRRNPSVSNLEVASRYVAGAQGVDVGGDWYSLIRIDDRHFAFAVGDVMGRGVEAAAMMAHLRFTIRAYLLEGHQPDVVLGMCSQQFDISVDGRFATVLVGVGDLETGVVTLANAGHLEPLLVSRDGADFVPTAVGLPLGIAPSDYALHEVRMSPGSTLIAFTDGLVERRDEDIGAGLERLARAAATPSDDLDSFLSKLLLEMVPNGSEDDTAVLAFRWAGSVLPQASNPTASSGTATA